MRISNMTIGSMQRMDHLSPICLSKTKESYIVILTGRQGDSAISSAKEAGANAFLRKPFKNSEFTEVVNRGMKVASAKKEAK